jgi:hypothetical protein
MNPIHAGILEQEGSIRPPGIIASAFLKRRIPANHENIFETGAVGQGELDID